MRLADVPSSVVVKKDTIPYQGVAIDITFSEAFKSLHHLMTVDEKERHFLTTKV
jgi:hypothetical protein